jgi:hypothetical protein
VELGRLVLILLLYVLACARVTKLINSDVIFDPPRLAVARRARNPDVSDSRRARWATATYFLECPWCVGLWVCFAGAYPLMRLIHWPTWALVPVALAASHLIGVCARWTVDDDPEMEEV